MKRLLVLVILFSFKSSDLFAQFKFGDIEVSSMEMIFNPVESKLWNSKRGSNSYRFKDEISDIWTGSKYTGLVINERTKINTASFIAKSHYEVNTLVEQTRQQLGKQLDNFRKVEIENPAVIGGGKVEMFKWAYEENQKQYELYLGEVNKRVMLIIKQL